MLLPAALAAKSHLGHHEGIGAVTHQALAGELHAKAAGGVGCGVRELTRQPIHPGDKLWAAPWAGGSTGSGLHEALQATAQRDSGLNGCDVLPPRGGTKPGPSQPAYPACLLDLQLPLQQLEPLLRQGGREGRRQGAGGGTLAPCSPDTPVSTLRHRCGRGRTNSLVCANQAPLCQAAPWLVATLDVLPTVQ